MVSRDGLGMIERHGYQPWRIGKKIVAFNHNGMVSPKHSSWTQDINMITQRLKDAGIINHFIRKYLKLRFLVEETLKVTSTPAAFRVEHILGMVLIWMVGMVVATLAFIVECRSMFC